MITRREYLTAPCLPSPILRGFGAMPDRDHRHQVRSPTAHSSAAWRQVNNSGTIAGACVVGVSFGIGHRLPTLGIMGLGGAIG
jgi:hypothetical protein